jgi:hypothetical protein
MSIQEKSLKIKPDLSSPSYMRDLVIIGKGCGGSWLWEGRYQIVSTYAVWNRIA